MAKQYKEGMTLAEVEALYVWPEKTPEAMPKGTKEVSISYKGDESVVIATKHMAYLELLKEALRYRKISWLQGLSSDGIAIEIYRKDFPRLREEIAQRGRAAFVLDQLMGQE